MRDSPPIAIQQNPVWAALAGPQSHLAVHDGGAARLEFGAVPLLAVHDRRDHTAWQDLRGLVSPHKPGMMILDEAKVPDDWAILDARPMLQMVGGTAPGPRRTVARPGIEPFSYPDGLHAIEPSLLSNVVGLRRWGQVVAVAGDHLRTGEWTEIVAAGTRRQWRSWPTIAQVACAGARRRGEQPFLFAPIDDPRLINELRWRGFMLCASAWLVKVGLL